MEGSDGDGQDAQASRRRARAYVPLDCKIYTRAALSDARSEKDKLRKAARAWSSENEILVGAFSTPREQGDASFVTTAFCMSCTNCREGNGKTFRFQGAWLEQGQMYRLSICTSGEHKGEPVRRRGKKKPVQVMPTNEERRKVVAAADALQERGLKATASSVSVFLGEDRVAAEATRAILRHRRGRQGGATKLFQESQPEFLTWSERRSDTVKDVLMKPFSYVILILGFFEALEQLGASKICLAADFTHSLELMSFRWGVVSLVLYRCLGGSWRRTPWPLAFVCYAVEASAGYLKVFQAVQSLAGISLTCLPASTLLTLALKTRSLEAYAI